MQTLPTSDVKDSFLVRQRARILVGMILVVASLGCLWYAVLVVGSSRFRAEWEHGIRLPDSARNIQCQGDAWRMFLDRGACTLFEINTADLGSFTRQLDGSHSVPSTPDAGGDPLEGNKKYWVPALRTFVPGSEGNIYWIFARTWQGKPTPREAYSCNSPCGDWLHVEIWDVDGHLLVKMFTDWN